MLPAVLAYTGNRGDRRGWRNILSHTKVRVGGPMGLVKVVAVVGLVRLVHLVVADGQDTLHC